MRGTVDELKKGISTFLEFFIFEPLDSITIKRIENELGNGLKHFGIEKYDLRSTILYHHTLKVNLQFDKHNIDFYVAKEP